MTNLMQAATALNDMAAVLGIVDKFTIGQVVTKFRDVLTNFVYETWNKMMDLIDFRRAMKELIRTSAQDAYIEGMREGGDKITVEDLEDADYAAINTWIDSQLPYVNDFAKTVFAAREDGSLRQGVIARIDYWVEALRTLGLFGTSITQSNRMVTWKINAVGRTKEHCATCTMLNGKRHRLIWFTSKGYIPREPGSEKLECHGFNCGCGLVGDDGKVVM